MGLLERTTAAVLLLLAGLDRSDPLGPDQALLRRSQQLQTGRGVAGFNRAQAGEQGAALATIQLFPGLGLLQPQGLPRRGRSRAFCRRIGTITRHDAGLGPGDGTGSGQAKGQGDHKRGL